MSGQITATCTHAVNVNCLRGVIHRVEDNIIPQKKQSDAFFFPGSCVITCVFADSYLTGATGTIALRVDQLIFPAAKEIFGQGISVKGVPAGYTLSGGCVL